MSGSQWPVPVITIACNRCPRRETFVRADLMMNLGDMRLTDLRLKLTADCPRMGETSIYEQCGSRLEMPET